jgi:GT2 family glycosyltransferase
MGASGSFPRTVAERTSAEPAVDVGLPAYRRPELIRDSIESVLAQTHSNWSLVISENGPGGGEVEQAVRPFTRHPRIRYVATGRNLGASANWTRLIQAGSAPYFSLLQDDDVWDPGFLAARVRFLEEHPSCAFVFSGERKLDGDGREIAVERTRSLPTRDVSEVLEQGVYSPEQFVVAMYRHQLGGIHAPAMSSAGVMSRRSALETVGAYFDDTVPFLFADVELYTRMAFSFPTGFLATRDVACRMHVSEGSSHASITSAETFNGERWIRYHDYYGEWIRRALPGLKLPRQFHALRARAHIMAALDAIERGERRKGGRYLRRAIRVNPPALINPRVTVASIGLLLGDRGIRLLSRARDAARRRNEVVAYESAETEED